MDIRYLIVLAFLVFSAYDGSTNSFRVPFVDEVYRMAGIFVKKWTTTWTDWICHFFMFTTSLCLTKHVLTKPQTAQDEVTVNRYRMLSTFGIGVLYCLYYHEVIVSIGGPRYSGIFIIVLLIFFLLKRNTAAERLKAEQDAAH